MKKGAHIIFGKKLYTEKSFSSIFSDNFCMENFYKLLHEWQYNSDFYIISF